MSQAEDMAAISQYFDRTFANTPTAANIKAAFAGWYNGLSWWNKSMDDDSLKEAKLRRDSFNLSNARTDHEIQQVKMVMATGMNTAEMEGKAIPLTHGEKTKIRAMLDKNIVAGRGTIRKGDTGPAVVELQKNLGITSDGKFGSGTEAALKEYQKKKGLVADGVCGPVTWGTFTSDPMTLPEGRRFPDQADIKAAQSPASISRPKKTPAKKAPVFKTPEKKEPVKATTVKASPRTNTPTTTPTVKPAEVPTVAKAGFFDSLMALPTYAKVAIVALFGAGVAAYGSTTVEGYKKRNQ